MTVRRSNDFRTRIESFALDNIARRLALCLIRCYSRLGQQNEQGVIEIPAMTHELLSQYVGTSRELVTHLMNQFRQMGCVSYSRRSILLHEEMLTQWMRDGSKIPGVVITAAGRRALINDSEGQMRGALS